jgi:hypothetical protein
MALMFASLISMSTPSHQVAMHLLLHISSAQSAEMSIGESVLTQIRQLLR